ncbi:unnamed protein product [Nippostrongylus brasiliensis]|uniref:Uncharacterized protein n=1 Tax=Nippostrongylus brasiliensis TaxID=27835 RepID=A0A0N4XUE4_NIPBR|nr:unnamed protein product [Nippostrongylus brasiliensis]
MDDSPTSPERTRRISLDSTSTSEFEVVSRERSTSGSTIGESNFSDDSMSAQKSSPSSSFNMPPLYSGYESNGQSSTRVRFAPLEPQPHGQRDDWNAGTGPAGVVGYQEQELFGMWLYLPLEKMALQSNEWRSATEQLEDQNKKLLKSLKSFKTREEELVDEVNRLQREKDEFAEKAKTAALIKEQRNSDVLREKLELMDELVERLEAERIKEYQRGVDEASKQVANDMSADIALARKEYYDINGVSILYERFWKSDVVVSHHIRQFSPSIPIKQLRRLFKRELEHERLIEAYREKMRLYDDLAAMKKAAKMEKEVLLADVTLSRKNSALNDSSILLLALTCL